MTDPAAKARSLAEIHAACFTLPRPWNAAEIEDFLASPLCLLAERPGGFALARVIIDEAELLTIAVAPDQRRKGLGTELLRTVLDEARKRGAQTIFLEVAAGNLAALALYSAHGFGEVARRAGYYSDGDQTDDAIVMRLDLGAPADMRGL